MATGCTQTVPPYRFKEDKDMYAEPFDSALSFSVEFEDGFRILTNAKAKVEREFEKLRHENDIYKKVQLQMEERIKTLESVCSMLTDQLKTQRGTIENLNRMNSNLQTSAIPPKVLNFEKGKEIKTESHILAAETGVDVSSPKSETSESTIIQASPIVLRSRQNVKRRLMCISSKKKNIINADHENIDFDLDFCQLEMIDSDLKSDRTKYVAPLDNDSSVVLNGTLQGNRQNIYDSSKQILNTINGDIIHNNYSPENKKREAEDEAEKPKPKTTWNLTRSREPNNKKLKQTVLSTAVVEKKVDICTLNDFKSDFITPEKKFENFVSLKDKENEHCRLSEGSVLHEKKSEANKPMGDKGNNTIFQPNVTSTAINHIIDVMKTPTRLENSFDIIPNTSPKYMYKRDAVRKKLERRKLPGQGCDKCMKLYEQFRADGFSDSEVEEMMNKCSKHRNKFPIQSNTPPGLWNPVFTNENSL